MTKQKQELPPWLSPDDWSDYVEYRTEIKSPLTEVGKRRALKRLERLHEQGEDISEVITQTCMSIRKSDGKPWTGLFPVKNRERSRYSDNFHQAKTAEISDEKAAESIKRIHEMTGGIFKTVPGGRQR